MTQSDILIRAPRPGDHARLSAIWYAASREAHGFLGEDRLRAQRKLIETQYLPGSELWLACRQDRPVGFIGLLGAFIGGLFVAPEQQGQGIGRALVAHAAGLKGQLELEVYSANARACAFYRGLGFVEISRRPDDDEGLPFETLRLRREA